MNPDYLRPIADHLWQSSVFAGTAGLVTLALRKNRARLRHWLWLVASCKFLIPLSFLIALGSRLAWWTAPPKTPLRLPAVCQGGRGKGMAGTNPLQPRNRAVP